MTSTAPKTYPRYIPQLFIALVVIIGIFLFFQLSQNASRLQQATSIESTISAELFIEQTRAVEIAATAAYVESDEYVADYNREEANRVLEGEEVIQTILIEATPLPTPIPEPTPDPVNNSRPWQMWWHLLTDAPQPENR